MLRSNEKHRSGPGLVELLRGSPRRAMVETGAAPARSRCAGSRPASLKRPAIKQQSVTVSTPPAASSSGSTEAESVCSHERGRDRVEGKRAPTRSNPDERGRGDSNNGEGKPRGQRGRRRERNAVRAAGHGPQATSLFFKRGKPLVRLQRRHRSR